VLAHFSYTLVAFVGVPLHLLPGDAFPEGLTIFMMPFLLVIPAVLSLPFYALCPYLEWRARPTDVRTYRRTLLRRAILITVSVWFGLYGLLLLSHVLFPNAPPAA
jgi:hypothetical protein